MPISHLILDVDDTLYSPGTGLFTATKQRAMDFIVASQKLTIDQAVEKSTHYFKNYGSILTGLLTEEKIDPDEFIKYVFSIRVEDYVSPDPNLHQLLQSLSSIKRILFSDSPRPYIERLLNILGIKDDIDGIYDRLFLNYLSKASPESFRIVLNDLKVDSESCLMVDDSPANLKLAKDFKIKTVWISSMNALNKYPFVDHYITEIYQIGDIIKQYN